ncbi:MAG: M20/M25/M40 family metallo-hydrolase [Phenylobacterium sp.]
MGRLLALLAALIGAGLIAWADARLARPAPANAPAGAFSAGRAMADVRVMGAAPHPMGSPRNLQVRDYLLGRMTDLGLSPQIHRDNAVVQRQVRGAAYVAGGPVENLVGVLPGRDRALPAVALEAHYDSVPASPGAADDAAGVASALETIRAIKARGVPDRDIIVLLTDGEESGLLGASAFYARDPLARRVGFLINMEARGGGGRTQMFQTGARNGAAIDLLRRTAVRPAASSLSGFIYEKMPNDTDFTEAKKVGVTGFNYAFVGRQFDYHSATSTPANLEQGSLQDMGDQVLAAARALAFAPALPEPRPDAVYSQTFGDLLIAYPPWVGWIVLAAAAGLIAVGVARARRTEAFPWLDVARGVGGALFATVGGASVLHFARRATGADFGYFEQRVLLAQVTRWELALFLLGLGFVLFAAAELARGRRTLAFFPLAVGLAGSAFGGFDKVGLGLGVAAALIALAAAGRPASRPGAWTGVLLSGLVLAIAAQVLAPATAFVIAWPLTLAAVAAAVSAMAAWRGIPALAAMAVLAGIGLGGIGGLAHLTYLSLDLPELLALTLWLTALLVWPLAQPEEGAPPARLVGHLLMAAGVIVLVAVRFDPPWDARHPQASYVAYHVDQDAARAWRVSALKANPWTLAVLEADGGRITRVDHWGLNRRVDAAPARMVPAPAPTITFTKAADGALLLHAAPPPGARILALQLKPNTVVTLEAVAGLPVKAPLRPGAWSRLRWEAAPGGVDLVLRPGGPGALEVRYAATLESWPAAAKPLPARPATVMAFDTSDSTLVTGTRRFVW